MGIKSVICSAMAIATSLGYGVEKLPEGASSGAVIPGEWNTSFTAVKAYSEENHIPMVVFMGSKDCHYCNTLISTALNSTKFMKWQEERKLVMAFCDTAKSFSDLLSQPVYGWFVEQRGSVTAIPMIGVSWPKAGGETVVDTFVGRDGKMPVTEGALAEQLIESIELTVEPYGKYNGGEFTTGMTVGDRLEAQVGYTTHVDVPLERKVAQAGVGFVNQLSYSVGGVTTTTNVIWAAEETKKTVRIPVDPDFRSAGDVMALKLSSKNSADVFTNLIAFVERENSPKNPLWVGECDEDDLQWGEWTMDLDVATNKVIGFNRKNAGSRAYTLALVAGGLWCPDCARTDAHLVDTPEFKNWAIQNKIACVAVDIPNYPSVGACLLNREVKEVSESYRAADPDHGAYQSGVGYLSRWMISDEAAEKVMERNAKLVRTNTLNGGWNRPERANQNRTGVPIFVLLRDDGTIAGRIEVFASKSPDDKTYLVGNIRRLNELLATVDKPEEESNFHPATTKMCVNAQGGVCDVSLSGADLADAFKVTNVVKFAKLVVAASGNSEGGVQHVLSIYAKRDGVIAQVASASGLLTAQGLVVSNDIDDVEAEYFARLELAGLTDLALFGQDNPISTTATLSCNLAYEYGEVAFEDDSQSVFVPDGHGEVTVCRTDGIYGKAAVRVYVKDEGTAKGLYAFAPTNLVWESGEDDVKTVSFEVFRKDELASGDFTLALTAADGNMATISSGTHVVTLEDTEDPCFKDFDIAVSAQLQFAVEEYFELQNVDTSKTLTLRKVAGALPSGLRLAYDRTTGMVKLSGTPKKAGVYSAIYTVTQNRKTGPAAEISITVTDPQDKNPFVNLARASQTLPMMARSGTNDVVAGALTVAVTSKNKISAKYMGTEVKTLAFYGNWTEIDADGNALAMLVTPAGSLELNMDVRGALTAKLELVGDCSYFESSQLGSAKWPAKEFSDWAGYYTITLVDRDTSPDRVEPVGTGYLTLTVSNTGAARWTGVLPSGATVSGSSQLQAPYVDGEKDNAADAMVFKRSSKDIFASLFSIKANADRWPDKDYLQMIHDVGESSAYVLHREADFAYLVYQLTYGGWYVKNLAPDALCAVLNYDSADLTLSFDSTALAASEKHGAMYEIDPSTVVANARTLSIVDGAAGVRLSFSKATGVFGGSAKIYFEDGKSVQGTCRGVLMPGWESCECGEERVLVNRPFGSGTLYFKDVVNGRTVSRSMPVTLKAVALPE